MVIVFRVDSSKYIGMGHVVRCLALAEELRERGVNVFFVCRELPGDRIDFIEQRKFPVLRLSYSEGEIAKLSDSRPWIDGLQQNDLKESLNHMEKLDHVDWIIVDHYGLNKVWEHECRNYVAKIMVIGGLLGREHDCDALLDPNFVGDINNSNILNCRLLCGPQYALVRKEFLRYCGKVIIKPKVNRLIIAMGGGDDRGAILWILNSLRELCSHIAINILLSKVNCNLTAINNWVQNNKAGNIIINIDEPDIAGLMVNADLAIIAGGSTVFEAAALGLPSLVISISYNQKEAVKIWQKVGSVVYMGVFGEVTREEFQLRLQQVIDGYEIRKKMSLLGCRLVDGRGVKKVADFLMNK